MEKTPVFPVKQVRHFFAGIFYAGILLVACVNNRSFNFRTALTTVSCNENAFFASGAECINSKKTVILALSATPRFKFNVKILKVFKRSNSRTDCRRIYRRLSRFRCR